jgi:hypothetical protein
MNMLTDVPSVGLNIFFMLILEPASVVRGTRNTTGNSIINHGEETHLQGGNYPK